MGGGGYISVSQDPYLSEVFSQPPLTAYKRQKNIRDHLIRARVPKNPRNFPERNRRRMKKCGKNCTACPYIKEVKSLKMNEVEWKINQSLDFTSSNCIYMIQCSKDNCNMRYIGETKRVMKFRFAEHRGYVTNQILSTPTGEHFNLPGHSLADMNMLILEKVRSRDDLYRKEREKYFIRKFNTYYRGLNKQP